MSHILDFLVNGVPRMQDKVDIPFDVVGGLFKLIGKHHHAPPSVAENAAKVETLRENVNKPFDAINNVVNQTVGLGFLRDALARGGYTENSMPSTPMEALRYMYGHRNDQGPTLGIDTNGLLPKPYEYQGTPSFRMMMNGRENI